MVKFTSKKMEHRNLMDNIETLLRNRGRAKRSTIADHVEIPETASWSDSYLKKMLIPDALKKMREDGRIEIAETRQEGGNPTEYWTLTD